MSEKREPLPADFDPAAYYASHPEHERFPDRKNPCLSEIFAAPVVGDGFVGDQLLEEPAE